MDTDPPIDNRIASALEFIRQRIVEWTVHAASLEDSANSEWPWIVIADLDDIATILKDTPYEQETIE